MTDTERNETSLGGLKLAGWVILGLVILGAIGSIILFTLKLIAFALIVAVAALVGWLVWLFLKKKWENRNQY